MNHRVAYPLLDNHLSCRGWVRVGQEGELIIESEGCASEGLPVSDAVELAMAVLKRARPEHRLIELSELEELSERLEALVVEVEES